MPVRGYTVEDARREIALRSRSAARRGGGRRHQRGGGGGAPAAPLTVMGLADWNSTARYERSNAGSLAGSATMSIGIVFRLALVPSAFQGLAQYGGFSAAARGWVIDVSNTNLLRATIANGTPAAAMAPTYTVVAGDAGKIFVYFLTYDGAAVRAFQQTAEVVAEIGSGTAATGYTVPGAGDDFVIGNGVQGTWNRPATLTRIVSVFGSDTDVWTVPEMQAIADELRTLGRLDTAVPNEAARYRARDVVPPAQWAGQSGLALDVQGSDTSLLTQVEWEPEWR